MTLVEICADRKKRAQSSLNTSCCLNTNVVNLMLSNTNVVNVCV